MVMQAINLYNLTSSVCFWGIVSYIKLQVQHRNIQLHLIQKDVIYIIKGMINIHSHCKNSSKLDEWSLLYTATSHDNKMKVIYEHNMHGIMEEFAP